MVCPPIVRKTKADRLAMVIPALCEQCNLLFGFRPPSQFYGPYNIMRACKTNCPRCGGIADIFDAATDRQGRLMVFAANAYILLTSPATSDQHITQIQKIILDQQQKNKDPELVAEEICTVVSCGGNMHRLTQVFRPF